MEKTRNGPKRRHLFSNRSDEVAIIGGGLAGLVAAYRCGTIGLSTVLLDDSLPAANGRLGGFAEFSGAKFSLLPAGQGLISLAGTERKLRSVLDSVLDVLGISRDCSTGNNVRTGLIASDELDLRSYESVVLTSDRVQEVIERLSAQLGNCSIRKERVDAIRRVNGGWQIRTQQGEKVETNRVLYCGGRAGGGLLTVAGAAPQPGKGLDVGVRVEFQDKSALGQLRRLGPDAKIISGRCRTFCLNSPGTIYRYAYKDLTIPGGIVAESHTQSANVGLLIRCTNKQQLLEATQRVAARIGRKAYERELVTRTTGLADKEGMSTEAWGRETTDVLANFCDSLHQQQLINWSTPHVIHWPLLDWHWPTFAVGDTSKTTLPDLFVAGDAAGHARGLLQAAANGWLAADEMNDDS